MSLSRCIPFLLEDRWPDTSLRMSSVELYLKKWQLSDSNKIAQTQTSDIFKVTHAEQPAVLKVLTKLGQQDESNGAIALRHFNGVGVVRLLQADKGAHLMTFADGKPLREIVFSGLDEGATQIVCEVVQNLHSSSKIKPDGLKSLPENFKSLSASPHLKFDPTLAEGAKIAESLIETERDQVVLHGDIHHANIIESGGWVGRHRPKGALR